MAGTTDQRPMAAEHENIAAFSDQKKERHWRASTVALVVLMACGNMAQAYSAGVIGTTLGQPSFAAYMGLAKMKNVNAVIGALVSLFFAGGFFGAFVANWIADKYGRKPAILVGVIIVMISSALCAGSVNISMFIAFRFTSGFGAFMVIVAVPLWITECVPPEVRGAFAQISSSAITCGYFLSAYIGVAFYLNVPTANVNAWRGPLAVGCGFCLPLLVGIWWIPESPRFLLMKGRDEEARKVVLRLHSTPADTEHRFAEMELYQMKRQIELDRTLGSSWLAILRRPSYRKRLAMAIFVVWTIQATGSQVVAIYATTIYADLGFGAKKSLLLQSAIFAINWPITFFAIFWTEKIRRPTLIVVGLVGMVAAICCYAGLTATYLTSTNKAGQIAATAMTYVFFSFYAGCVDGPMFYYSSEIFPTHLRAKGATIQATTYAWTTVLWSQVAPIAIASIGWKFFLIFIFLVTIGAVIIFVYFPDTQGKSLEEIAGLFGDDDLVVVYRQDIFMDVNNHEVVEKGDADEKVEVMSVEQEVHS